MTFDNFFKKISIVLVVLIIFLLLILLFPLFYSRYLHKTEPPTNLVNINMAQESGLSQNPNDKIFKIATIGDSTALGQGTGSVKKSFSYQYAEKYLLPKYKQINYSNFSVSGSTVSGVLDKQISSINAQNFDLIFVSIGSNDVTDIKTNDVEFAQNIQKLLQKLQATNAKIIWLSIPDFVTAPVLLPPLNLFLSGRAKHLNQVTQSILDQNDIKLVDVFDRTREGFLNDPVKYFSEDKYHPSQVGYSSWAESIFTDFGSLEQ